MTYIAISLITYMQPLSDPAVSIADREPTRGPVYITASGSTALQIGGEYVKNRILSGV